MHNPWERIAVLNLSPLFSNSLCDGMNVPHFLLKANKKWERFLPQYIFPFQVWPVVPLQSEGRLLTEHGAFWFVSNFSGSFTMTHKCLKMMLVCWTEIVEMKPLQHSDSVPMIRMILNNVFHWLESFESVWKGTFSCKCQSGHCEDSLSWTTEKIKAHCQSLDWKVQFDIRFKKKNQLKEALTNEISQNISCQFLHAGYFRIDSSALCPKHSYTTCSKWNYFTDSFSLFNRGIWTTSAVIKA